MRIIKPILLISLLGIFIGTISMSLAQTTDTQSFTVSTITIEGNERVADGTILAYLPIQIGDETTLITLNQAVSSLFATSLFSDVLITRDEQNVLIKVVENPVINRINIEGNDVLDDERLLPELDVQPRRIYTREVATRATQKLLDIYRLSGRFAARVVPKIIRLDNNRVDLIFEVDEGPLIKIQSIRFIGNNVFSDYTLRQTISSRQERWWAFLSSSDKYDPGRLDYDARLLRQFYLSRGYADIDIERVQGGLLPDRTGFAVTFAIHEGPRYRLRDVSFTSQIESVDLSDLRSLVPLEKGDWYDVREIEQGLLNITNELGNFGYAFVNVTPTAQSDPDNQEIDFIINIGPSRRNYVERIDIINNTRSTDKIIRREFEIIEGDAYNQLKVDRSIRNIRNLGFFRNVSIETLQGSSSDQSILRLDVEEQPTGNLSLGVGYSSLDKSTITFGVNERNFLGSGRTVKFSVSASNARTDYRIGLTEPYLFDRNLQGSIELFNQEVEADTVDRRTTGVSTAVSFNAAKNYYHRIGYEYALTNSTEKNSNVTSVTGDENKSLKRSSFSYTLGRSTLNNRFDPSEGYLMEVTEEYSGLGGNVTFLRSRARAGYYKSYLFNKVVLGWRGQIGFVDGLGEKVSQNSRFSLGGRSVRGFDGGGIGPRDRGTGASVGGNYMYTGTVELVSKLGFSEDLGIRWTVFSDIGSVWETDYPAGVIAPDNDALRQSLGVGILWDTAIGPLSFNWAKAVNKQSHDRTRLFQFNIGTRF